MPIVLLLFFSAFYLIYKDIKTRTINEFNNEQLVIARTASQGITSFFNDNLSDLVFLSQFKDIIDFSDKSKALMASMITCLTLFFYHSLRTSSIFRTKARH